MKIDNLPTNIKAAIVNTLVQTGLHLTKLAYSKLRSFQPTNNTQIKRRRKK